MLIRIIFSDQITTSNILQL